MSKTTQNFQQTEGIILKSVPFREYDQILTLFTLDLGRKTFFYKRSRNKRSGVQSICMPLTRVEVIYRETSGEMYQCQEMSLLNGNYALRQRLESLEAACQLTQALLDSQLEEKPAPLLYALLCFYLVKIPHHPFPGTLTTSFYFKLLKQEGLLAVPFRCQECQESLLTTAYLQAVDAFCSIHQRQGTCPWNAEELDWMSQLTLCEYYQQLSQLQIPEAFQRKARAFFEISLKETTK